MFKEKKGIKVCTPAEELGVMLAEGYICVHIHALQFLSTAVVCCVAVAVKL